ncbi:MAG: hypothetical protein VKL20_01965 [Synechocystis sp.]|nr:hypothetical protein [Synechocystis sp.]
MAILTGTAIAFLCWGVPRSTEKNGIAMITIENVTAVTIESHPHGKIGSRQNPATGLIFPGLNLRLINLN